MIDYFEGPHAGTEGQLLQTLRRLDRSRFEPFLCCLWSTPWVHDHITPCDCTVLFSKPPRWFSTPSSVIRVRDFLRAQKFDIVHTFFPTSNTLGVLAARLASAQVIISSRRDLGYWKKWTDRALLRAVRRTPACYLANSRAVKRETQKSEGIDPGRITVIHNGIDVRAYEVDFRKQVAALKSRYNVLWDAPIVGVVANYHRSVKGVNYFIEAAKLIAAEIEESFFFVVGSGQAESEHALCRRVNELGLERRFVFAGLQEDVRPFLSMFDVGILPSLSEGLSNSLLEYMAAGLPVIASDVGGNRELIIDGRTGFLVPPGNPHALAEKVVLLLKQPVLRERLGRQARERAKTHFSMRRMIGELEELYEKLHRSNAHPR